MGLFLAEPRTAQLARFRAPTERDEPSKIEAVDTYDAEADVLADADTFGDWLAAECMGHGAVQTDWFAATDEAAKDYCDRARTTVPQLVALLHNPVAHVRAAAAGELSARYLVAKQARINALAGEKAAERAIEERF